MEKVDVNSFGINRKLAEKYNAIVNFLSNHKSTTVYRDGCIHALIKEVEYIRYDDDKNIFKTDDYIKITESTFGHTIWVNNPSALRVDRKHGMVVKVGDLEI